MTRASTIKVLAVYWALLAFGITMYTSIRSDALELLAPVWIGTFVGTVVGQVLALRRSHAWLLVLVIVGGGMIWIPQLPDAMALGRVWMAYVPAALCGYWVLGDRTSLLAFWFPAMIWMLSILDGTGPNAMPDATGLILLGGLALLFVVFLRVREERRIALWRSVAPTPLAVVKPLVLLREGASGKLPRIMWTVVMSALGFAATMWLAPRMWKAETFDGGHFESASRQAQIGVPCCPRHATAPVIRARLKEYFDFGRGHENTGAAVHAPGCRVCDGNDESDLANQADRDRIAAYTGGDYESTFRDPGYAGGGGMGGGGSTYVAGSNGALIESAEPAPSPAPYVPPTYGPPTPPYAPSYEPPTEVAPAHPQPHRPVRAPSPHVAPVPALVAPPVAPTIAPPEPPIVTPSLEGPTAPREAPSKLAAPELAAEQAPEVRTPSNNPAGLLRWIAILLGTLLLGQLLALVLRPVRRAIALRHLERPFWSETVDQRVSNAWQLALIGLRDGGWRTSAHESPAALAKRVDLPGLDRCATILERARHGIGIDHDDLAEMTTTAVGVYRSARAHATPFARIAAWLRWPLG